MKTLILSAVLMFGFASVAFADASLSVEESAVIMYPDFQKTLTALRAEADARGELLRVESFYRLEVPPDKVFIYANVMTKKRADLNPSWETIGNVVAGLTYGPTGEVLVNSSYFSSVAPPR